MFGYYILFVKVQKWTSKFVKTRKQKRCTLRRLNVPNFCYVQKQSGFKGKNAKIINKSINFCWDCYTLIRISILFIFCAVWWNNSLEAELTFYPPFGLTKILLVPSKYEIIFGAISQYLNFLYCFPFSCRS